MDNYINQIISDRYEIKEIIGVGGMSKVYKAYDRVDDRIVAVKILKDEYLDSEDYRVRFKNESHAISLLNHINVVKVYDVCFGEDIQYIVMEHVEGITLKEFIAKQHILDWKEALIIVVQILRALQHAHDKGVIHRDIKPQNILLLSNATIKVTDFGIAGFKRGGIRSPEEKEALGSVHYVSPEQAVGEHTDERSDIYSVGVVLYEMLTGKMPFESDEDENVVLMQMSSDAVKPTELNPSIPLALEQITLKAMQKNADHRYQSASEFLMDLDEFRKNPEIVFDYHYFVDKTPTKFIPTAGGFTSDASVKHNDDYYADEIDEDDDFYDEDDDDDEGSSALPVIIGVAIAIVLIVAIVIFGVFGSTIKDVMFGDSQSQSDEGSFFDKLDIFGLFSKDEVEVPYFINMKFEDVLEQYPDFAIENPPQYEYNSTYEDGYVCKQYPDAGDKVSKDTVLKLTVATSSESVLIQDITGKKSVEAESILRAAGFAVEMIPLVDDSKDEGEVIYTKPSANTYAPFKSTVYVYYATGKNSVNSTRVPRVIGLDEEAAKAKILAAGLTVGAITQGASDASLKGFVISQTPDAATGVNAGVNVNIVIGNGIPATNTAIFNVSLPALGGTTGTLKTYLNDVLYDSIPGVALNGEKHQVSFTGSGKENSFKILCDAVLIYTGDIDFTTTPPTFSNVRGYQFSTKVSVPNVVGLTRSEAESILASAGFNRVKITQEASDTVAEGVVISQSPIYSDSAKYSTATIVTVVVSSGANALPPIEGESEATTGSFEENTTTGIVDTPIIENTTAEVSSDVIQPEVENTNQIV